MKQIMDIRQVLTLVLVFVASACRGSVVEEITRVDSKLSALGPTMEVLQEYSALVPELQKLSDTDPGSRLHLARVYYKKGLVEFSLSQDNLAVQDFESCLAYDASFKPCQQELNKLNLKLGRLTELETYISSKEGERDSQLQELEDQYTELKNMCSLIESSVIDKDYDQCVDLTTKALEISSSFPAIRYLRSHCLSSSKNYSPDKLTMLVGDYSDLLKNSHYSLNLPSHTTSILPRLEEFTKEKSPEQRLGNFIRLFQLQAFVTSNSPQPQKILQKCLRVDNDYHPCAAYSKLYSKLARFRELFAKASLYYSHVYFKSQDENLHQDEETFRVDEFEPTEEEWQELHRILFQDKVKFTPNMLKGMMLDKAPGNYHDLLELLGKRADATFNLPEEHNSFLLDLRRISIESTPNHKEAAKRCKKLRDPNTFLPCQIANIDKALLGKSYAKAEELLNQFDSRVKKTQLWKSRYDVLDKEFLAAKRQDQKRRDQEHERQRFKQQQQHQRQQQQRYQQYQQQQQQQASKPKNDYYKILDIAKDADEATVKRAYRNKVKQHHPDKVKGTNQSQEEMEAKMALINSAYEVLSDKEKREQYDRGHDVNDPESRAQQPPPNAQFFHQGQNFGFGGQQFGFGGQNGFFQGSQGNQHFKFRKMKKGGR
ncbi:unnamed protein product [Kuraishia capsulata CBS 1993]|uniref:J domain-containing protein n=1 Tax=Kuraishia capsulata CBS 1993 TaxID=1382522 RepID=W6MGU3_9ASCO|nr:uncharacterized protein KUCA_T00001053001 [Kuraishia capsulata CBS 1993]CDK25086.1 unnamed protein product [Kuraishia capsulata CBS 1993]